MISLCILVCLQDPAHTHLFPTCVYGSCCVLQITRLLIGGSPHTNRTVSPNSVHLRNHTCCFSSVAWEDIAGVGQGLCSGVCYGGIQREEKVKMKISQGNSEAQWERREGWGLGRKEGKKVDREREMKSGDEE